MQTYAPIASLQRRTEPQSVLHIRHNTMCQICSSEKRDLRQLPCQHEFCKQCLKVHIEATDIQQSQFYCPICKSAVSVPKGVSKDKLMQSFIKSESKSVFYDPEGDTILRTVSYNDVKDVIKRPTCGSNKQDLSTRRTALRITGSLLGQIQGFRIRGPEDETICMCWGVDCFPNGDIVLADWNNSCVKLYSQDGIFLSNLKIDHKPLGVCALDHGGLLVSLGSRHKLLYSLKVKNGDLHPDRIFPLKGYLYDLTRYKDKCLGICQIDENIIELLKVNRDGKTCLKCIDKGNEALLSHSGICFKQRPSPGIFFTSGCKLIALHTSGSLMYQRSYNFTEEGVKKKYTLGAICLDSRDGLFIASDYCVLHVDRNSELINVMPTKIDPFAITVQSDGITLVIVGRNKVAETYRIRYGIQS